MKPLANEILFLSCQAHISANRRCSLSEVVTQRASDDIYVRTPPPPARLFRIPTAAGTDRALTRAHSDGVLMSACTGMHTGAFDLGVETASSHQLHDTIARGERRHLLLNESMSPPRSVTPPHRANSDDGHRDVGNDGRSARSLSGSPHKVSAYEVADDISFQSTMI